MNTVFRIFNVYIWQKLILSCFAKYGQRNDLKGLERTLGPIIKLSTRERSYCVHNALHSVLPLLLSFYYLTFSTLTIGIIITCFSHCKVMIFFHNVFSQWFISRKIRHILALELILKRGPLKIYWCGVCQRVHGQLKELPVAKAATIRAIK